MSELTSEEAFEEFLDGIGRWAEFFGLERDDGISEDIDFADEIVQELYQNNVEKYG